MYFIEEIHHKGVLLLTC